jgi:hypothetical protein
MLNVGLNKNPGGLRRTPGAVVRPGVASNPKPATAYKTGMDAPPFPIAVCGNH